MLPVVYICMYADNLFKFLPYFVEYSRVAWQLCAHHMVLNNTWTTSAEALRVPLLEIKIITERNLVNRLWKTIYIYLVIDIHIYIYTYIHIYMYASV